MFAISKRVGATFTVALMLAQVIYQKSFRKKLRNLPITPIYLRVQLHIIFKIRKNAFRFTTYFDQ